MQLRHLTAMLLLTCASALGMAKKPAVTVRFHTEANPQDGPSVTMPVKLRYQQRDAYLSKYADFSEANVKAIFPFRTADGSWGCVFQLDESGRIRLQTISNSMRGLALVVFIGTKNGTHQVVDMKIDREVADGIISVQRGITDGEVLILQKQFKIMGKELKGLAPKKKEPSPDPTPGSDPRQLPGLIEPRPPRTPADPRLPREAD
jgi:hypothetical protein